MMQPIDPFTYGNCISDFRCIPFRGSLNPINTIVYYCYTGAGATSARDPNGGVSTPSNIKHILLLFRNIIKILTIPNYFDQVRLFSRWSSWADTGLACVLFLGGTVTRRTKKNRRIPNLELPVHASSGRRRTWGRLLGGDHTRLLHADNKERTLDRI